MFPDTALPALQPQPDDAEPTTVARVGRALDPRLACGTAPLRLRVQHLLGPSADIEAIAQALRQAGAQIGVELVLDARDGDIVLLDRALADPTAPQLMAAFVEGRPCMVLDGLHERPANRPPLRRQLRAQLLALPMLQALQAPSRGAALGGADDSALDSLWPLELSVDDSAGSGLQLLQQLHKRQGQAAAAPLRASYGPGADLHFDFQAGRVRGDVQAVQRLRLQHELPALVPDLAAPAVARSLPLHQALWDLGAAAGRLPLLGQPLRWWHVPLAGAGGAVDGNFTRVPRFLDVLRRLDAGAATPAELRREGRVGVADLRRVLQACLLLGLARWRPAT